MSVKDYVIRPFKHHEFVTRSMLGMGVLSEDEYEVLQSIQEQRDPRIEGAKLPGIINMLERSNFIKKA